MFVRRQSRLKYLKNNVALDSKWIGVVSATSFWFHSFDTGAVLFERCFAKNRLEVGEDKMKLAVIFSLLMMFAFLTMVTETDGKPANEDEHETGAKKVFIKKIGKQSDSQMNKQKRDSCSCCDLTIVC
ncbi:hypothetical protein ACROYT_G038116 [Oculina patagonica]